MDWEIGKVLLGTFAGAALAFGSAFLIQHLQRRRDQYAAAAAAMEDTSDATR
jgi:hypothetical protein